MNKVTPAPLQRHDMIAERWLGDIHLDRGTTEVEFLGDRSEKG